tara:strand:- start:1159 stop:1497 length:339 start_codon:yes stop_codon:yes gene_type:complete
MAYELITFETPLNTSIQVGDTAHFSAVTSSIAIQSSQEAGTIVEINKTDQSIVIERASNTSIGIGDFISFSKNINVNESSLKGYYANVTFENSSHTRSELFAISSEIAISSK